MGTNDQHRCVGKRTKLRKPCLGRLCLVIVGGNGPFRVRQLAGVVYKVTGNERFFAFGGYFHTHMTNRVAWGWDEPHFASDLFIVADQLY